MTVGTILSHYPKERLLSLRRFEQHLVMLLPSVPNINAHRLLCGHQLYNKLLRLLHRLSLQLVWRVSHYYPITLPRQIRQGVLPYPNRDLVTALLHPHLLSHPRQPIHPRRSLTHTKP